MKKLIIIILGVILSLSACQKSVETTEYYPPPTAGGLYRSYTAVVQNKFNTQFTISDSTYHCNLVEACLYSHEPTSEQDCFYLSLIDTTPQAQCTITLKIYTPWMKPEAFFTKGSYIIDTLSISHHKLNRDFQDDLVGVNAVFTWDTAWYENLQFKGIGRLQFTKKETGPFVSGDFYPAQKVEFEF